MKAETYECHLTLEPVFDARRIALQALCLDYGYHLADLLLEKSRAASAVRSNKDAFCTARATEFHTVDISSRRLMVALAENGFKVWRRKIEKTILDESFK